MNLKKYKYVEFWYKWRTTTKWHQAIKVKRKYFIDGSQTKPFDINHRYERSKYVSELRASL